MPGRQPSCGEGRVPRRRSGVLTLALGALGRLPELFQGIEALVLGLLAAGGQRRLHGAEAALELGVGAAQRRFRIDVLVTRQVDDDEQQVADLVRSEEHTSELQSLMRISYAVFCLKKKNHRTTTTLKHIII